MLIKTSFEASHFVGIEEDRLEVPCGGDLKIVISIERVQTTGRFSCTALGDVTPPPTEIMENLTEYVPPPNPEFRSYLLSIESHLYEYLRRAVRLLMWRRGQGEDYKLLLSGREAFWSTDGKQWHPIGLVVSLGGTIGIPMNRGPVPREIIAEVGEWVESGLDEPIAHGLLREAWLQKYESPRNSVVFAIAAAEVGFKHCVSTLVPDASWLVEKIQTPPLYRMIKEYLPLLPVKASLEGKTLVPPDELLHEIRTGNDLRNEVSHQGQTTITSEKLGRILRAVSDLLWILDLYQGRKWVIGNISPAVLANWKPDSQ